MYVGQHLVFRNYCQVYSYTVSVLSQAASCVSMVQERLVKYLLHDVKFVEQLFGYKNCDMDEDFEK